MKILIAIATCESWEDNGNNQAVRDTWLKDLPACTVDGHSERVIEHKFFIGDGGRTAKDDIIIVPAPDDYCGIIRKTQMIHAWSVCYGYDFTFQCWPDTYVNVPALLSSGFEKHDYFGHSSPYVHDWFRKDVAQGYLGGGEGWWTSARASDIIVNAEATLSPLYNSGAADDLYWGGVLAKAGIVLVDHPGYGSGITLHGSVDCGGQGQYNKEWMYQTYDNRR